MDVNSGATLDLSPLLRCQKQGCDSPITKVVSAAAGNSMLLHCFCAAGHRSRGELTVSNMILTEQETAPAVRTKVAGVSYPNPDGTSRQAILKRVRSGDALRVERAAAPSGGAMYMLRHELGYIGSVKGSVLQKIQAMCPQGCISVRVTQVTGGTEDKATLGCNIELYVPSEGGQPLDALISDETGMAGDSRKESPVVFLDSSRRIYHWDERCSGMKNAERSTLYHAVNHLHARPCKKCDSMSPNGRKE